MNTGGYYVIKLANEKAYNGLNQGCHCLVLTGFEIQGLFQDFQGPFQKLHYSVY